MWRERKSLFLQHTRSFAAVLVLCGEVIPIVQSLLGRHSPKLLEINLLKTIYLGDCNYIVVIDYFRGKTCNLSNNIYLAIYKQRTLSGSAVGSKPRKTSYNMNQPL